MKGVALLLLIVGMAGAALLPDGTPPPARPLVVPLTTDPAISLFCPLTEGAFPAYSYTQQTGDKTYSAVVYGAGPVRVGLHVDGALVTADAPCSPCVLRVPAALLPADSAVELWVTATLLSCIGPGAVIGAPNLRVTP